MSRLFCIPAIAFLFVALVLSFLSSISLPYLPALDVTRTHFPTSALDNSSVAITELRFGIWTACYYNQNEDRTCLRTGHAYTTPVSTIDRSQTVVIGASWTRGLAVQPVATAATLVALCLSLSQHLLVMLLASLAAFLAATLHLISFVIQIALFAYVRNRMGDLNVGARTNPGPGFWLVFVSLILCLLAGCTVCFGRRRDREALGPAAVTTSSSSGLFGRFRRNKV